MNDEFNVTYRADEGFFDLLESNAFKDKPSDEIFEFLSNRVKLTPFCVYLKRLLSQKIDFNGSCEDVDDEDYKDYIVSSFRERNVPASFKNASTKISAAAKNWLKAATVSRETVLLLGFGLKLTSAEVSDLLAKGLNESKINYRNSLEAICSYCYENGFPYSKMRELNEKLIGNAQNVFKEYGECGETVQIASLVRRAINDDELLKIIRDYKLDPCNMFSQTAKKEFDRLYKECSDIVTKRKRFEDDEWDISAIRFKGKLTDAIKKKLQGKPDVSTSDIEKVLNTGTPVDENGNLIKFSKSALCEAFQKKRLTRNHISDIMLGKEPVDRFDLITMQFFISSYTDYDKPNNARWYLFVEKCNDMLAKCSMGQLYNANPYDAFLQMCMLTDVPMATYDDILEMSYCGA